jgi:DNA invertase Pin-like site-specific DNA recombinase
MAKRAETMIGAEVAPAARGVLVGYARTSTVEQEAGLEAQQRDLATAGCGKVFAERVSSVGKRQQLEAALDYLRDGDVLTVTKPDRLARSVADLLSIVARLETKGVGLLVLSMGGTAVDTRTPTGRLTLTMLGAVAEFERALMLERQREGIAKAKGEGRYKGRKPTAMAKAGDVLRLHADNIKPTVIAEKLGISRASVYRAIAEGKPG